MNLKRGARVRMEEDVEKPARAAHGKKRRGSKSSAVAAAELAAQDTPENAEDWWSA